MTFLQPAMLLGLPVIAVPIIIHLINQRRYQTVPWAAMSFLLSATKMSRGYARIKQWLILAARTLALFGLVFAISRPLMSGWLGLAASSRVDTTLVVLDRSPSMTQLGGGGPSKLATARQRLVESLRTMPGGRIVLIDGVRDDPLEVASPDDLLDLPQTRASSVTSDLPAMMQRVADYLRDNRPSRCEVWICSDIRRSDWRDESGRWEAIRTALAELPQVARVHLLAYPDVADDNRSIRLTGVRRREGPSGAELLLSLKIERSLPGGPAAESGAEGERPAESFPIRLELDGSRSEWYVEMRGSELELVDHAIPLDRSQRRGWGRVSIPADACAADNEFYFVYDEPVPRKTLIVAERVEAVRPLELAASIPADESIEASAEVVAADELAGIAWEELSLVLWQAPLPTGDAAAELETLVERGGRVIFFPPRGPGQNSFGGFRWTAWRTPEQPLRVSGWTDDRDLLAGAASGAALPVGELTFSAVCGIEGDGVSLATLAGGSPLLVSVPNERRNVYFCATTAQPERSSLAENGVVLYAMIQRALAAGAGSLGRARRHIAGEIDEASRKVAQAGGWELVSGNREALSTRYHAHAGVYRDGERWLAVNRSPAEDRAEIVPAGKVQALFDGIPFDRIDDTAGADVSLVQEVWRLFLIVMVGALLVEAGLCLPRKRPTAAAGVAR